MRFTGSCWCSVGLAAVFLQGVWGSDTEDRGESRRKHSKWSKDWSNTWPKVEQKVVDEGQDVRRPFRNSEAGQPVHGLAPTPLPTYTNGVKQAVPSPQITDGPTLLRRKYGSMRWDGIQDGFLALARRDSEACPSNFQSCPASVGGGCCPQNGYSCGTSSCLPVTASSASACGFAGYVACPFADGGGCCPPNYICAAESCSPSPGVASLTCAGNSFLCPASLGGGCCPNGMGCALSACYNTNPITFTLTDTITTTNAKSSTVTLTSTITSTTISGAPDPTDTVAVVVPKVQGSATAVAKTQPTGSNSSSSGLSSGALGGIIGGAIFFLSAILIAAIFIIRGLNRASKAQELANSRASGSSQYRSRGGGSNQHRPSGSQDIDTMSIDPLIMTGSTVSGSVRRQNGSSGILTPPTPLPEMEGGSPPTFTSPFSPRSPPHTHYPRGYSAVANTDQYSQSSGGYRDASIDSSSSPPTQYNPHGYFDLPVRHSNNPNNRASLISASTARRPSHGRNYSNSSEVSQTSSAAELDGTSSPKYSNSGEGRSPFNRFMTRFTSHRRRVSESPVALSGGPMRGQGGDWPPSPASGGGVAGAGLGGVMGGGMDGNCGYNGVGGNGGTGLGFIAEAGESKIAVNTGDEMRERRGEQMVDISLMDQPPGFRLR